MIPKIIHYCWFGWKPLSKDTLYFIQTWKKHLPDYKIKEWNEKNIDFLSNKYLSEAYNAKKFAFVSDYVRLLVLKDYWWIYLDTDVEVLRNFDEFLNLEAFIGFENNNLIWTATIWAEKNNEFINYLLKQYQNKSFINENWDYDLTPNTELITQILIDRFWLRLNNKFQKLKYINVFPEFYFSPKDLNSWKIKLTKNTYCIHHFSWSRIPIKFKIKNKIINILDKLRILKILKIILNKR